MRGAPGELSDMEIVSRVRAGETALFEILVRRYNQRLYRVARAILRDEAEAEDAMQQAYVNAYLHLDQFADRASFSTWLTRIAAHEALARARRRARAAPAVAIDDPPPRAEEGMSLLSSSDPSPEHQAFAGELRALLEAAIDALPQAYRSVFVLREVEGLSTAETAECLDLSEEAVKTRLHRAKQLLREALYDRAGVAAPEAFQFHLARCDRVVAGVFERLAAAHLPPAPAAGTDTRGPST
ncbi:MAG TPA: RNA polymerase sigma factor [Vicinamibacterales bacterium]|nr:RNA polymerase sigma factor [Vicinamibacterales bacterium]